jgi:pilus assembly protein CpaE
VATSEQIRLLLVEDVAQVSQYVRNLLQHQKPVRLLDTITDGRVVLDRIRELRPDVIMVDALLQGKASGLEVAEQVRQAGLRIPIIIVTVPQKPVKVGEGMGIIEVLAMPFSGFELMNALNRANTRYRATAPSAMSRSYVVYSGKGGVGRTTIAYNLAVAFGQMPGVRVALIDGDLQFSDLRGLLRVPDTAPSLLQLPTDRISESDLASVLWRDPSGIDRLLAPARVEQSEMVTSRDIEKVLSLLRRIYNIIVVDAPPAITDANLVYLADADGILTIVTPDRNAVRAARLAGQSFIAAGMSPHKMMLVLNRAGAPGVTSEQLVAELGRLPDVAIPDDQPLVKATTAEGVPFVMAHPKAPASQRIMSIAQHLMTPPEPVAAQPAPSLAPSFV